MSARARFVDAKGMLEVSAPEEQAFAAIRRNDPEAMAKAMQGADPREFRDRSGRPAMAACAVHGAPDCFARLARMGCCPARDGSDIYAAAANGHLAVLQEFFLNFGERLPLELAHKALIGAAWHGRAQCARYLMDKCGIDALVIAASEAKESGEDALSEEIAAAAASRREKLAVDSAIQSAGHGAAGHAPTKKSQ